MKAEYIKDLNGCTLVLEDEYGCTNKDYQIQMFTRNKIPMYLACRRQITDGVLYFYYDTAGYQPFSKCFQSRTLRYEDMKNLLVSIEQAAKHAEEYLLDPSGILLEPEYIFITADRKEYGFCFLPGRRLSFEEAFYGLAEYLLERLDYTDREGVVLGYEIYRKVKEGHGCLENLLELLKEERIVPETEMYNGSCRESLSKEEAADEPLMLDKEVKKVTSRARASVKKKRTIKIPFKWIAGIMLCAAAGLFACIQKEIIVLPEEIAEHMEIKIRPGATAELLIYQQRQAVLMGIIIMLVVIILIFWAARRRKKNSQPPAPVVLWRESETPPVMNPTTFLGGSQGEEDHKLIDGETQDEIPLTGDVFYVGKIEGKADLCLKDDTVSRMHACLKMKNGQWFVSDLNSTNGTFLNGERIKEKESILLSQGDELCFAKRSFLFL